MKALLLLFIIVFASADTKNADLFLIKSIFCFILLLTISFKYLKEE